MKRFVVLFGQHACVSTLLLPLFAFVLLPPPAALKADSPQHESGDRLVASRSVTIDWEDDFELGWRAARETGRPMLIFITSEQCRYCDAMKMTTWSDSRLLERVQERFIAIRLSPRRNAGVLSRIKIPAYPMTLIGHPSGKVIAHKIGYQPPEEIDRLIESVGRATP